MEGTRAAGRRPFMPRKPLERVGDEAAPRRAAGAPDTCTARDTRLAALTRRLRFTEKAMTHGRRQATTAARSGRQTPRGERPLRRRRTDGAQGATQGAARTTARARRAARTPRRRTPNPGRAAPA